MWEWILKWFYLPQVIKAALNQVKAVAQGGVTDADITTAKWVCQEFQEKFLNMWLLVKHPDYSVQQSLSCNYFHGELLMVLH